MTATTSISYRIKIILIAVGAFLLYGFVAGIRANASILSEALAEYTGLNYGDVTVAFSVMNFVFALSVVTFGILSLRVKKFHILLVGVIASFTGFMGASLCTSQVGLILFLGVFLGIGASALCYSIVFAAAEPFIQKQYLPVFSGILVSAQGIFGTLLAPAMDGTIDAFGLTACLKLISLGVLCLIPFVILFIQKKNLSGAEDVQQSVHPLTIPAVLKRIVTHPFFYLIAFCSFTFGIADGGMMNHLFQYYLNLGVPSELSTTIVSVYSFSIIIGGLFGGLLCMKCRNHRMCLGTIFASWVVVSYVIGFIVLLFVDVPEIRMVIVLVSVFVSGTLMNATMPIIAVMITKRVSAGALAMALIIMEFSAMIGYSVDAFIGGLSFDLFGVFFPADLLAYVLAIVAAVIFLTLGIHQKRKGLQEEVIF